MRFVTRRSLLCAAPCIAASRTFAEAPTPSTLKADRIRVLKSQRLLLLLANMVALKSYPIALGRHPSAQKNGRAVAGRQKDFT